MQVEDLLARLQGVHARGPSRWVARCPAHKDRSPSLSIKAEADGRILLHDFGGCDVLAVLDALNLSASELFPPRLSEHHHARIAHPHQHAAADAIRVMSREALVLIFAANDMAAGVILSPATRARMLEAALTIRGAARLV